MKSKSSREPVNADISRLITIIQSAHAKNRRRRFLATAALCLGIVLAGFLVITAVEQQAYLPPSIKVSLTSLLLFAVIIIAVWSTRLTAKEHFDRFYVRFARYAALPSLKNAFDLTLNRRDSNLRLYDAALSQNIHQLDETGIRYKLQSFLQKEDSSKQFKFSMAFMGVALLGTFMTGWFLPDAVHRVLHMWNHYEAPNPYAYTVEPGNVTLEQGNSLVPFIIFDGDHPKELTFRFKTDSEREYRSRPVLRSSQDTVFFSSVNLNSNSSYYFTMDEFQSQHYRANVQLPPRFELLHAQIIPPEYTGLDTISHTYPFSDLKAYQGSRILLSGTVNKPLASLSLTRSVTQYDSVALQTDTDNRFSDTLLVSQTDTVAFIMRDTSGLANNNPFEFIIEPREDEIPTVTILEPESDLEMKNPRDLRMSYEATDDFELASSHLRYEIRRAFAESPSEGFTRLPTPTANRSMSYTWKLEELDPRPRDVITYWIQVTDNNGYKGPQTAISRKLTVTFPSLTSYLDELENKERDVEESLNNISDSHQLLRQEYDRFKENLRQNPEGNWEQQQKLNEVKEQHKKLNKKVEDLNKKFEEIRQEMQNSDVMSDKTLKAYEELQDLMKEIDDPELLKALEQLQNSLSNMNQQQLKEALENFEFNEQQYQERIKRTIELFKTLKMNSDLEKTAAALEELAEQEKELSESEDSSANRVKKQEAVRQDARKLSDELQNLSKNAPDRNKKDVTQLEQESIRKMEAINKQLDANIQKMRRSSQDAEQSEEIRKQQQQIQHNFQQMAQQMRSAQKKLGQQRNQINMAALRYILYSLINLSQNQEELTRTTEQLSSRSQAFVEQARKQQTITDQFNQLSDSLFKVSAEIPSFSNKINEKKMTIGKQLDSSVDMLAERDRSQSTFASRQALAGFNELSSMLATLLDQLQNQQQQGGGSGMSMQQLMEQLQQMSGQQQEMNRRIDELINDIQGDRLSNEQIDRLNQLARQQNRIRKQIKELQEKGGLESGDKILSELERLSEEMEETINDLRGGQTDETLVKRQQNILSRMLSAEKALNKRGEDEKREATTAEESPRSTPPDITLEELEKNIRKLLNDPDQTRFSQDYQRLIEQYFRLLRDLEKGS